MIFIADLIAYSTCFGHHYAHHPGLESIIQVVVACGIWCFGFQIHITFSSTPYSVARRTAPSTHTTFATYSTQCTHLATRLSNITTVTKGQKTIGSETQSDLLMMGVKTPETC
jgi:hypothetical protein